MRDDTARLPANVGPSRGSNDPGPERSPVISTRSVAAELDPAAFVVCRRGGSAREPAAHRVPSPAVGCSRARTAIIRGDLRTALPTLPAFIVEGA